MEEVNLNETAVEETAISEKALNCDSNEPKKTKTPAMFKAGIALMCATSALSLGAIGACGFLGYKLYKNQKNQNSTQQDSMGSVVASKQPTISEDGYWVIDGVKTPFKAEVTDGEDGADGISVVNASIVNLDKWGITTQIQFKMSDNSYIVTAPQTQIMSEHFYEAEDMSDILTLTEGYGISKIKLSKNVYLSSSIEFAGDTVIDLNRKTLDYVAINPLKVAENSTLTFKNGSVNFKNSVGISVEGENAELSFEKVTVGATSTVAETLENNAAITLTNTTVQTIQQGYGASRSSVGSLFIIKGENANITVTGSKFNTTKSIVSASENATEFKIAIKETKINTTAPILDIDTDEVVPTLDIDNSTMQNSTVTELNTSPITSGKFNVDPTELGATLEGVEQFTVNGATVLAEDLNALVDIIESGSTITLTKDIVISGENVDTEDAKIYVDKNLTLDLNGHSINADFGVGANNFFVFRVIENGKLTINDSVGDGSISSYATTGGYALYVDGGELIINGGSYDGNPTAVHVRTGKAIINNGFFESSETGEYRYVVNCTDDNYRNETAVIEINGGTFNNFNPANNAAEGVGTNFVAEGKIVAGKGDTYTVTSPDKFAELIADEDVNYISLYSDILLDRGVVVEKELTLNLNSYSISAPTSASTALIRVNANGYLTIEGNGTINSASNANDYSIAVWASNGGQVTINGGTYTNVGAKDFEDNGVTPNNNELIYVSGTGSLITINNATIIGNSENKTWGTRYTLNMQDKCASEIVVNGGTFVKYDPSMSKSENPIANFVADGKLIYKVGNNYTVAPVANLVEILNNNAGATITLFKSFNVTSEVTLNLNGCTITAPHSASTSLFTVESTGVLTINGEGIINSASDSNDYSMAIWARNGGQVVINGGTFTNLGGRDYEVDEKGNLIIEDKKANNNELIYVSGSDSLITINAGTFIGNSENRKWGTRYTLNMQDKCASEIVVNGGTFVKYDPSMSKSENPIANFVSDGKLIYKVGNNYTVAPVANLVEILNNNAGATITLFKSFNVTSEVTLNLNGCTITAPHSASTSLFTVESTGVLTINGEGIINSASDSNDYSMAIWARNGGQVVINGGTFTNLGGRDYEVDEKGNLIIEDKKANNNELIYVSGSDSLITINAGTFIGNSENRKWGTRYTLNMQDKCASEIVVNGGTFVKYDPSMSKSENPIANFVADGYKVVVDGDNYTVVAE